MSDEFRSDGTIERLGLITKRFLGDRYRVSVAGRGLIDAVLHETLRGNEPRIGVGDTVRVALAAQPETPACIVHHESSAAKSMLVFTDSSSLS